MTPDRRSSAVGLVPEGWNVMPLGAVAEKVSRPVDVDAEGVYREIGIRSHGKGVFHKEPVKGATLGAKRVFEIVPNCLVFNIVFAWEGAVAVTTDRERGMIASHRFPMFGPTTADLIDVEFLRRFFQTKLGVRLLGDASPGGAGRNRTLNQKFAAEIPVPVPPLAEQKKIAAILSSVDDAIEATQAVIDQLQVVKKAMMAELLARGLPGRHTRFKMTEIGEVPEEWEVVHLGEVIRSGPDNGLYKPQSDYGTGTPIVRIDAYDNGDTVDGSALRRVRLAAEEAARFALRPGDILVNRVNSLSHIAKTAIVGDLSETTVFESNMMRLTLDGERLRPSYAFRVLAAPAAKAYFVANAKQAVAQASVNQQDVRALPVALPSPDEQDAIVAVLSGLDARLNADLDCLSALTNAKAALMSVLLTGEVRVTPSPSPDAA